MKALVLALLVACSASPAPPPEPKGPTPYSLAVVMSGWELWIGNDKTAKVPEDDPTRRPGLLLELAATIDKLDLAHTAPVGSQAMVVTYADKAVIRAPLAPITKFSGASLGKQDDYYGTTGLELVQGVTVALAELTKAPAGRKYLLVVGDGNDTNNEAAKGQLAGLKQQAAKLGVEVAAIVYRIPLSNRQNVVKELTGNVKEVSSGATLEADLRLLLPGLFK
jgi:hypothetical protein